MARLYMVSAVPKRASLVARIERALNREQDWFRYQDGLWIVASVDSAEDISEDLEPYVKPGGHIFVCRLDPSDFNGYMSTEFWDWLRRHP